MAGQQGGGMKVAELEGALLAQWVARANGWTVEVEDPDEEDSPLYCRDENGIPQSFTEHGYWPHVNWAQSGPIIEREQIAIESMDHHTPGSAWTAIVRGIFDYGAGGIEGQTPLIAAMRAYVASIYGDEVPDS
jgi:hypothetical protein